MKPRRLIQLAVLLVGTAFLTKYDARAQNPRPPATVTNTIWQPPDPVPVLRQPAPGVRTPPAVYSVPNYVAPGEVNNPDVLPPYGVGGFYQRGTNFFYPSGTNGFFRRGKQGESREYYPDNRDVYRRGPGGGYHRQELRSWDSHNSGTNNSSVVGTNGSSPYHMK